MHLFSRLTVEVVDAGFRHEVIDLASLLDRDVGRRVGALLDVLAEQRVYLSVECLPVESCLHLHWLFLAMTVIIKNYFKRD